MSMRLFFLLVFPWLAYANTAQQTELNAIDAQIEVLDAQLAADEAQQASLQKNLRDLDLQIAELAELLQKTQTAITQNEDALKNLEAEYKKDIQHLQQEQNLLREQIRGTFLLGQNQNLKLWLNQTDPQVLARLLTYFDYFNDVRSELMQDMHTDLSALKTAQAEKKAQQDTLQALYAKHQQAYDELNAQTSAQSNTVAQLLSLMEEKNLSLASLHADKEALGSVITQLTTDVQPTFAGDTNKPIRDYQKLLPWPVQGKVIHQFGDTYEADTTWQGILIAAPTGTPVHAVYSGQVVYADWLRGLGLIMIVNHGNDYLSLYAHNQSLYKNVGDSVAANEMIAQVGKSGSVAQSGLYFEMRFKGEVQNPSAWLRPIS